MAQRNPEYRAHHDGMGFYTVQVRWERQTLFRRRWVWTDWIPVMQKSGPMALLQYPLVWRSRARAEEMVAEMQRRAAEKS